MPGRKAVERWVEQIAKYMAPKNIVWFEGTEPEYRAIIEDMLDDRSLIRLNQKEYPGCYLHRSHPNDVARTERLTFISTPKRSDAGPTNNWIDPEEARGRIWPLFRRVMRNRTMYVLPYLMGQPGSPMARAGVELTDSPYVAICMRIMTRLGNAALDHVARDGHFVKGIHSVGEMDPSRRFIMHFPKEDEIWSVGSGYGGNALLGKKCHALRIASSDARREGWMAEHMLIIGVETPDKEVHYIAGAFPSACGKTNLAMLLPPAEMRGYKVWTVGDDIAWMRWGEDGRLYATNPESGFFGVVPLTSLKTNPNAMATIKRNTIYANIAMTHNGMPWWEGIDGPVPEELWDWRGYPWSHGGEKAAHPNARYAAPAAQCPCISPEWENPKGVPISAIIFGGRRAHVAPLVYESFSWQHGVYVGAGMATETTSAQSDGAVGVTRRDPMAMLPFCGYHMGEYFSHWLEQGRKEGAKLPKIFHVNWFRSDSGGHFLWPGFRDNLRALAWIVERCRGGGKAKETPIGYVPTPQGININGMSLSQGALNDLLSVDRDDWLAEIEDQEAFFASLGRRFPEEIRAEMQATLKRFGG